MADGKILRVFVVDDEQATLNLLTEVLADPDIELNTFAHAGDSLEAFSRLRPQMVLLDLGMPQDDGMEVLRRMVAGDPAVDIILMSSHYSTDTAVEAIQQGAYDYFSKPLDVAKLRRRISDTLEEARKRQRAARLDRELLHTFQYEGMIGRNPVMLELFAALRRVAQHFRTVLISGPTGTGKELVAKALHNLSPVRSKPLGVANCSAITETLVESELFGYVKGAFTGANQDKIGLFEYANGGTVLLDEIGELPLTAQAKLLRVLQNQEVQRVGSPALRKIDVRVVAVTNRDLRQLCAEKLFREDLYYRLSMVEIKLPSLNQRKDDLPLLQRHFLEKFNAQFGKDIRGITRRAQALLANYAWPGNVRELENVLGNACMMTEAAVIDVGDLPEHLRRGTAPVAGGSDDLLPLAEIERRYVREVLERVQGNKRRAAEILGISRATLYKMLGAAAKTTKGRES